MKKRGGKTTKWRWEVREVDFQEDVELTEGKVFDDRWDAVAFGWEIAKRWQEGPELPEVPLFRFTAMEMVADCGIGARVRLVEVDE